MKVSHSRQHSGCHCSVMRKLETLRNCVKALLKHLSRTCHGSLVRCRVVNGSNSPWPGSHAPVIGHYLSGIPHIIRTVLLLITHHYDGYLGVVPHAVAGAPGLGPGVRCVGPHWPGGATIRCWAGAAWETGGEEPVVCWHRPSADLTPGAPDTSWEQRDIGERLQAEWWHKARSRDHSRILPRCQHAEWGRVTAIWSSGAAFISSAPAWHTPPTQVSLGHQWNYLNVPRENILSAGKSEYDLIAAEGSRDKRPCSLSPSDCYGENFKSVRMPLITLQLYCSLIANFQDRIPQKSRKLLFTLAVYRW